MYFSKISPNFLHKMHSKTFCHRLDCHVVTLVVYFLLLSGGRAQSPFGPFSGRGSLIGGGMVGMGMNLPPGYAVIRGEVVDTRNKLVQRVSPTGTSYFSYESQMGPNAGNLKAIPIFHRQQRDNGLRFILLPDRNYPNGDGHYIILRKMFGALVPGVTPLPVYEAFHMALGESINGMVRNFDKSNYMESRSRTMMGMGGYGGESTFQRMKRDQSSSEFIPLFPITEALDDIFSDFTNDLVHDNKKRNESNTEEIMTNKN